MTLHCEFFDSGKPPQHPPDPRYPDGVDVDSSQGREPACWTKLPRVSTRGLMLVVCDVCRKRAVITVAGRVDDPRSYKMDCIPDKRH